MFGISKSNECWVKMCVGPYIAAVVIIRKSKQVGFPPFHCPWPETWGLPCRKKALEWFGNIAELASPRLMRWMKRSAQSKSGIAQRIAQRIAHVAAESRCHDDRPWDLGILIPILTNGKSFLDHGWIWVDHFCACLWIQGPNFHANFKV